MMRQSRKRRPVLEGLETRELLSTVSVHGLAQVHPLTVSQITQGTFSGNYKAVAPFPDAGSTYTFTGSGHVQNLGAVSLKGTAIQPGFVATAISTGTLKLSNSHGTVVLNLKAKPTAGFAPLPTQYHYTVANGTGSYHHLNGAGTLTLSLTPGVSSDPLTQTGSFKMSLKKA